LRFLTTTCEINERVDTDIGRNRYLRTEYEDKKHMKKLISMMMAATLLAGCSGQGLSGDPTATFLGAQVGGMMGQIIGDSAGGFRGAMLGSLIGTVTGAAVANAATTPSTEGEYTFGEEYNQTTVAPVYSQRTSSLAIRNIRFVDDNRSQSLEPEESAKIVFEVVNKGNADAYRVTPVVSEVNGNKQIYISSAAGIERIKAGDGIRYTANIRTGKRLRGDQAEFQISVIEADGVTTSSRVFAIPIRR
jgi:hypothetical protein